MKKSKKEAVKKAGILVLYPVVWIMCLACFWYNHEYVDAMGYALIVIWFLVPLTTFVSSLLIGLKNCLGKLNFIVPVVYGITYMLTGYLTFDLANTLHSGNVNTPEWYMIIVGAMISAVGLAIGWVFYKPAEIENKK